MAEKNSALVFKSEHLSRDQRRMIAIGEETESGAPARLPIEGQVPTEGKTMSMRRRVKQVISLQDRLISFANEARHKASLLPPGAERDALLEKARQADAALRLSNWANSRELQPPK
jgi:hypothetical protein